MLLRRIYSNSDLEKLSKSVSHPKYSANGNLKNLSENNSQQYLEKLINLLPAESVGLFITIDNIIQTAQNSPEPISYVFYWVVFLILTIITGFLTHFTTSNKELKIRWRQIILTCLAFCFWVFALGGPFVSLDFYRPIYAAIFLPIVSVILPFFIGKNK